MRDLAALYQARGAALAPDGIPLHFGDVGAEVDAALAGAVLMDRSHEGRLLLRGRDRLAIPHRISTQDVAALNVGEGNATLFTNPNARIVERAVICNLGDEVLLLGEPGRGPTLLAHLQRNIFYNDDMQVVDIRGDSHAFALHGVAADAVMSEWMDDTPNVPLFGVRSVMFAGQLVHAVRVKPLTGSAWTLVVPKAAVPALHEHIEESGRAHGLRLAGSLAFNVLRIRAGRPGIGRELSSEYLPLEVGLWDEVSFSKGCYTGQEIIARMESRGRLARTIVRVTLDGPVTAPAELTADGRAAGMLTSAVTLADGTHIGIAVVRMAYAQAGGMLLAGQTPVHILDLAGVQPPGLRDEAAADG